MRITSRKTLKDFWHIHRDAEDPIRAWYHEITVAKWRTPQELKSRFRSADILPGKRVVFNIKGNTYRLIVKIHYNTGIVFIRYVGTHADYNRIDAETI